MSLSRAIAAMATAAVLAHCAPSGTQTTHRKHAARRLDGITASETLRLAPPAFPVVSSTPLGSVNLPSMEQTGAPAQQKLRPIAAMAGSPPPGCSSYSLDMRVLVISTDGTEPDLPAIQQALGYHSVPHSTWIATKNPGRLTADQLATGCAGKYQGVILTTGALAYSPDGGATWRSALTAEEWQALRTYQANFHVREISWYVHPGADHGLNPPTSGSDTTQSPIAATLTAAGRTVFPYINTSNPIPITGVWAYRATAADSSVTPLLVDASGNALGASRVSTDGRETMTLTFDSNANLLHHAILSHGLVEWITGGIYLGEFRTYLTPHVDDLFIDNDLYFGGVYRMSAEDFEATHAWQMQQQSRPGNAQFRITWPFNAEGCIPGDPLTDVAVALNFDFHWINHTFNHEYLDQITYAGAWEQFDLNEKFAQQSGLGNYFTENVVTPDVSGLKNPDALAAAFDFGVRYLVSDTSQPGYDNPAPNIGIYNEHQPNLLLVPRRPTNLFYNVSTPQEWTAEYNAIYTSFWGRALTYAEILEKESDKLIIYMLRGEIDPHMYHQANTRAYDGFRTLLGDLHDVTLERFRKYSTLPIRSPQMHVAGSIMEDTMARNAAGVRGKWVPGTSVSLINPSASESVWVSVSGVCTTGAEMYAGKCISEVLLSPGETVTLPLK